jgi:hypothetical protein
VEIQNQDSHFPTAPTACGVRMKTLERKVQKVYTMRPAQCVYHAPVLTHVDAWSPTPKIYFPRR